MNYQQFLHVPGNEQGYQHYVSDIDASFTSKISLHGPHGYRKHNAKYLQAIVTDR